MRRRTLGATGLEVSEIGLGCADLGRPLVYRDADEWINFLHRAFDLGVTCFDTANIYRYGMSERLLGRAFRDRRDDVTIMTKVGAKLSRGKALLETLPTPLQRLRRSLNELRRPRSGGGRLHTDFAAAAITQNVEASLRRLKTEQIDVLLLHNPGIEDLEDAGVVGLMERLARAGKIRFWGVSADSLDVAQHALTVPGLSVIQLTYSLMQPEAGDTVIEAAGRHGIGIVARLVLARGLLTSKQALATGPRSLGGLDRDMVMRRARDIAAVAAEYGRQPGEAAVLFALAKPQVATALIGTTRAAHLSAAISSAGAPALLNEEIRRLAGHGV